MAPSWFAGWRRVALLAACYALAHAALSRLAGPALALDDAKMAVAAQAFRLGYQPGNPPLFEWLTLAVEPVVGVGLAPPIVRAALIALAAVFAWFAAREATGSEKRADLAAASLLLVVTFAWTLQQSFTHSAALVAAVAAFWAALIRMLKTRDSAAYLLLGAAAGAGLIAKYAFAPAAMIALFAAALTPEGRRALCDRRLALSVLIAALIAAPHAVWLAGGNSGAGAAMAERLGGAAPYGVRVLSGLASSALAAAAFFAPLALVAAALLRRETFARLAAPLPAGLAAARHAVALGLIAILLLAPVSGVARMEERYVIAFLFPGVLVLSAALGAAPPRRRAVLLAALAVALAALGARALAAAFPGPPFCKRCGRSTPYEALAGDLRAAGFDGAGALIGFDTETAGNLRRFFPRASVSSAHMPFLAPPPARAPACFFVWSLDLAPPPPEAVQAAFDATRLRAVEAQTRPLAGTRRSVTWTIAAIAPEHALHDALCAPPIRREGAFLRDPKTHDGRPARP